MRNTRLRGGHLVGGDLVRLHADADEVVLAVPRARAHLEVERDRVVALGLRVLVGEVVDELREEHRVLAAAAFPRLSIRRTLAYDAVFTSAENVESAATSGERNSFSRYVPYLSALAPSWPSCGAGLASPARARGSGFPSALPSASLPSFILPAASPPRPGTE